MMLAHRMRTLRIAVLASLSLTSLAVWAGGQDSHYWTNQYGSRATLLGGAVIGSVLDLSGTYYNPGGMSLVEKPQTIMAANVLRYPRVSLAGAPPGSVALNKYYPGPAPILLAGTIRIHGLHDHWFGYSYVARQSVKLGLSTSTAGTADILPAFPGPEDYVTQFKLDEKLSETWFGLTWSYKLSKHVGLGVTQYLAYRSHQGFVQELAETLDQGQRLGVAMGSRQYFYWHLRLLWKVGLACDFQTVTVGLTLTSPSLALGGRGQTGVDTTLSGVDMTGRQGSEDYLASNYQRRLPATYASPVSIAAGVTFKIEKVRLYGSAEWFAAVRPYTVIAAEPFVAQSTGEILSPDVTQELESVLNWGLGVEWVYSKRFKGYASFTTDFSAKKPGTATNLALTDWDIVHLVTGAEFTIKKSSLTFGAGVSFGGKEVGMGPDILAQSGLAAVWDPFATLKFRYVCYKLIVGFAI
jgi:hypothetical protein